MAKRRYGPYTIETSREDKPIFPGDGILKSDVIDYYDRMAGHMDRYLRDRPLVMKRYPDGIGQEGFYQKQIPDYFPGWIDSVTVEKKGGEQSLVVCNNRATLVYLANQMCLTPHVWFSRIDSLDHPDQLIFDLDPPDDDFDPVRRAAGKCKDLLEGLGLPSFVRATGSRGLHVMIPLDGSADFDAVRDFAQKAARVLALRFPEELTVEARREKRKGRLYLDVNRNAYAQTASTSYALRALPGAPVVTPLDWEEVDDPDINAQTYCMENIFQRLSHKEDPWAGFARRKRSLDRAAKKVNRLLDGLEAEE